MSIMRVTQLDTILFTSKPEPSGGNLYLVDGIIILYRRDFSFVYYLFSSNRKIVFLPINQRSEHLKQNGLNWILFRVRNRAWKYGRKKQIILSAVPYEIGVFLGSFCTTSSWKRVGISLKQNRCGAICTYINL